MNSDRTTSAFFKALIIPAWWMLALFGSAGRLDWTRGWICTVLYLGTMYGSRALLNKLNPSVVQSRQESIRKDTKAFDRMFLRSFLLLIIIFPIVAGFDAVRFHWSGFPYWTVYLGIALFAPSAVLITWTLAMNPHAETSVRIQSDRGHSVIHSGPYRFVRHPMYVGLILLYMSMSLILGSFATFGVAAAITVLVLWRTALEDRTLRRELPGYEDYTSMTRYRLMPGIW